MENIILNTNRLILKSPVGIVSAQDVLKAINNKQTLRFLSSVPFDYSIENAMSFLEFLEYANASKDMLELGMFRVDTNEFIGMMTLGNINFTKKTCEIGYWLTASCTGKGYAIEGAKVLLNYAFNEVSILRVDAFVIKENIKSIKLLDKLGFIQDELLLNNIKNKGVLVDRYQYVLKKETFFGKNI